ncbi:MAG TPA: type II-A CRISPR-associated protein Csn2, partial [Bacilli bacterium]|nr:type II-A CRISPR-associated protein Csn2 [Bacilli bacterium]
MIIKISTFSNHIDFTNNELNVLEIEDKKLFSNIVTSFYNSINDEPSKETLILLKNNEVVSISKCMFMIMDIYSYDFNVKKININELSAYIVVTCFINSQQNEMLIGASLLKNDEYYAIIRAAL